MPPPPSAHGAGGETKSKRARYVRLVAGAAPLHRKSFQRAINNVKRSSLREPASLPSRCAYQASAATIAPSLVDNAKPLSPLSRQRLADKPLGIQRYARRPPNTHRLWQLIRIDSRANGRLTRSIGHSLWRIIAFFYAVYCRTPALDASPWHGQSDQSSEAPESGFFTAE